MVAEYGRLSEARMARDSLVDAGVDAWLEGSPAGDPFGGLPAGLCLVVAPEDADEARALLEELRAGWAPATSRRPVWVTAVAAVVLAGLVWGAVPRFLWPWLLFVGLIGFLVWRAVSPRRP